MNTPVILAAWFLLTVIFSSCAPLKHTVSPEQTHKALKLVNADALSQILAVGIHHGQLITPFRLAPSGSAVVKISRNHLGERNVLIDVDGGRTYSFSVSSDQQTVTVDQFKLARVQAFSLRSRGVLGPRVAQNWGFSSLAKLVDYRLEVSRCLQTGKNLIYLNEAVANDPLIVVSF